MTSAVPTLTRQQRYMTMALDHVSSVSGAGSKEMRNIYGGLAHSFPILVRTNGLCQALAFLEAKATSSDDRGQAYKLLRQHVAAVLGQSPTTLLQAVRGADVVEYMRFTRSVIDAWIFYKRFAVSILKVESAQAAEEEPTS